MITMSADSSAIRSDRIVEYEWIRMIAIILVVFGHSGYLFSHYNIGGIDYALPQDISPWYDSLFFRGWRNAIDFIYTFHMPLFFILSGAVYGVGIRKHPTQSLRQLVRTKGMRLLWPYLVCGLLLMLPLKFLCGYYDPAIWKKVLFYFLAGPEAGHLWFLQSLFWCFVVSWGLLQINRRLGGNPVTLLAAGLIFVEGVAFWYPWIGNCFNLNLIYMRYYLLAFLFGMGFEHYRQYVDRKIAQWPTLRYAVIFAGIGLLTFGNRVPILNGIAAWLVLYAAVAVLKLREQRNQQRWLGLISRNFFGIYLLHDPFNYVVLKFAMRDGWLTTASGVWTFYLVRSVGLLLLSIALCEIFNTLRKLLPPGVIASGRAKSTNHPEKIQ